MRKFILASAAAATLAGGLAPAGGALAQAGSYQRSCRNPQNVNGTLTAECADAQGQYHSTSIAAGQCRGDIANANGTLTCPGAQGTAGPVIGQGQRAQQGQQAQQYQRGNSGGGNYRGDNNQNNNYRGNNNNRDNNNAGAAAAGVFAGALLGGALAGNGGVVPPPPPPPPAYGDSRYGDPRYDWRYQQGGYGYGRRPGEWVPIDRRAPWLNDQIDRLMRAGRIDYRDARDYRRQLNAIQRQERFMERDGRLGRREREDLDQRFNRLTEEIRHDAREN